MADKPKKRTRENPAETPQKAPRFVRVNDEKVRELREELNWTRDTLAKNSGVGLRTIESIETEAGHEVQRETLDKLAGGLGIARRLLIFSEADTLPEASPPRNVQVGLPNWIALHVRSISTFDLADVDVDGESAVKSAFSKLWRPEAPDISKDVWSSTIRRGAYWLKNRSGARDERKWVRIAPRDAHLTEAPVSVEVLANEHATSYRAGCGMLYRFQEPPRSYYSFMLTGDGQLRFSVMTENGERVLFQSRSDAVRAREFNKLAIASHKGDFHLYVNENHFKTVHDPKLRAGGVGIVASGLGESAFRNFIIYSERYPA